MALTILSMALTWSIYGTYGWQPGNWASSFYNYYYYILIYKLNYILSCLRVRVYEKRLPCCQVATSERQVVFRVVVEDDAFLIGLHILRRALDDEIATDAVITHPSETKLVEGKAHSRWAQLLADPCADNLNSPCGGHEHAVLAILGNTEIQRHQFLFEMGCLKLTVVMVKLLDLLLGEPVLEAAPVQGKRLAVDAVVVEWMVSWRDDALHLEGKPAAVAGGVAEELGVVARAAERRYVLAVLMVMGVCRTLVDARHGDGCLQLVQLGRAHGVKLLAADEGVLSQGQDVVLRHTFGVGLGVEILLQRRWKEVVEPSGLVRSLFADEHEDDVVHHVVAEPRRHHADEPFPQVAVPQHLLLIAAFHMDGIRQITNVIVIFFEHESLELHESFVCLGRRSVTGCMRSTIRFLC